MVFVLPSAFAISFVGNVCVLKCLKELMYNLYKSKWFHALLLYIIDIIGKVNNLTRISEKNDESISIYFVLSSIKALKQDSTFPSRQTLG